MKLYPGDLWLHRDGDIILFIIAADDTLIEQDRGGRIFKYVNMHGIQYHRRGFVYVYGPFDASKYWKLLVRCGLNTIKKESTEGTASLT